MDWMTWLGLGAFGVLGMAVVAERSRPRQPPLVEIDEVGVRRPIGGGVEAVRWDALVEVGIVTTADGPLLEDFYWILRDADGGGCAVPGEVGAPLLKRLQRLPRFDNEAVIRASCSVEEAAFLCWRGAPGEGAAAADDEPSSANDGTEHPR